MRWFQLLQEVAVKVIRLGRRDNVLQAPWEQRPSNSGEVDGLSW